MKGLSKSLSLIFILLFIAGIVAGAYFMYTLPDDLVTKTRVVDLSEISDVSPFLNRLSVILGAAAFSGLLAIVMLMANATRQSENVVYVEKFTDESRSKTQDSGEESQADTSDESEFAAVVRESIASEGTGKQKAERVLSAISDKLEASQGAMYLARYGDDRRMIELFASYAFIMPESATLSYEFGEGLAGQAAKEGKAVNISAVPDGYLKILSGLGSSTPTNLAIIPFKQGDTVAGIVEIASFKPFRDKDIKALEQAFAILPEAVGFDPTQLASQSPSVEQELVNE